MLSSGPVAGGTELIGEGIPKDIGCSEGLRGFLVSFLSHDIFCSEWDSLEEAGARRRQMSNFMFRFRPSRVDKLQVGLASVNSDLPPLV